MYTYISLYIQSSLGYAMAVLYLGEKERSQVVKGFHAVQDILKPAKGFCGKEVLRIWKVVWLYGNERMKN